MKRSIFRHTAMLCTAALAMFLFVLASPGQATAQGADDPAQVDAGKAVFETSCAGCHGDDGSGVAGRGRPLTGIASQGDRATHVASVTDGKGGMPEFGTKLSADEIDQAISYVRLSFVEAAAETTAETTSETELAVTGVGTGELALLGATLLIGGAQLVVWSKREQS